MRRIIYFLIPLLLTAACNSKKVIERLDEIDSLVTYEQYDSADIVLATIDTSLLKNENVKAHYYLLQTQLACVLRKKDSINILDSIVIPYYTKTANKEKLAEAYYYKAYDEIKQRHISTAVTYYKHAEELASHSSNLHLQYKIAESLSYANEVSGNYPYQLDYAQKTVKLSSAIGNKRWMAYSFINLALAYSSLGNKDSVLFYMNEAAQLSDYIPIKDKYGFLINLAYTYKYNKPEYAKKYLLESISIKETSYDVY